MDKLILLVLICALASCGGSGGGATQAPEPSPVVAVSLSGHAVKGPLANALFSAFELDTTSRNLFIEVPSAQASSDAQSRLSNMEIIDAVATPFFIEVNADTATDLSTGAPPILTTLRTVVTQDMLEAKKAIFPNPLTTIALEVARINADSSNGMFKGNNDSQISKDELSAALPLATRIVVQALGFGIQAQTDLFSEPPLVTASTTTTQLLNRVAIYRTAIETTTALILELQLAAGPNPPTTDALLMGLAYDLADGRIDGVYNGNSIEVFNDIFDIAAVLSIDQSLLLIPGTQVPVLDVKLEVAAETELTGFSEVNTTALTNGEIEVPPGSINLEPDSDFDGTLDVIDTAIDDACVPEIFVSACAQDSDSDGATDFAEGELIDSDDDGALDYLESSVVDTDSDGTSDQDDPQNNDPCLPNVFVSACAQDSDSDGATDFAEGELIDSDGDGVPDYLESSIVDSDSDGTSDQDDPQNNNACSPEVFVSACAQDSDNDGIADFFEGELTDSDGDGTPDYLESSIIDSDSDGFNDQADENNSEACLPSAFNISCLQDSDGDGDTDFNEGALNDSDGDGMPDYLESAILDTDIDGLSDQTDAGNTDACVPSAFNASCSQDSDGDGATDFAEGELIDSDGDGVPDYLESSMADTDSDGTSDQDDPQNNDACSPEVFISACAQDSDNDGIADFFEGELTDSDGDGNPDYLESSIIDIDSDGLSDQEDPQNNNACSPEVFVSACAQDSDDDGVPDSTEGEFTDSDGDGMPDYLESAILDTDIDGLSDQTDAGNTDACVPSAFNASCSQDSDGDGATDFAEGELIDSDGDGVPDYLESSMADTDSDGTSDQDDPQNNNACSPEVFISACAQDSDNDGIADFFEGELTDSDGDGNPDHLESSIVDSDSDGLSDQTDVENTDACVPSAFNASCAQDSDGDGATDFSEGELIDSDADGDPDFLESSITDTDSDGLSDQTDAGNTDACVPSAFNASCSQDSDGDGATDFAEGELIDSDGDGVPDYLESSMADTDSDGTSDQDDPQNNDACSPEVFVSACEQDSDDDGVPDSTEGEFTDSDGDGNPDYLESSIIDSDSDGISDQLDPENNNPCAPDTMASSCDFGILARPANGSCVAPALGTINSGSIALQHKFPNLTFSVPVKALQASADDTMWYVVQQSGEIMRFTNDDNTNTADLYFSIDAGWHPNTETGLLGMAFSPSWPEQKEFYIYYTRNNNGVISKLSRIVIIDDSALPVTYAEETIMIYDQPYNNHNGGDIAFGDDGYLYIGLGDGGSVNDPENRAQDTTNLFGSMLRIDVNNVAFPTPAYNIPPNNPFSSNAKCGPASNTQNCPEIYAWGLRNPWRWSFDSLNQSLWLGDVGQGLREEVDIIVAGGNYGWDCREGAIAGPTSDCQATMLIEPVHEYSHVNGDFSITGGYVYRGDNVPSLEGKYLFADYLSGRIWTLTNDGNDNFITDEIIDSNHLVSSFAQDNQGELYITSYLSGEIYQIVNDGEVIDSSTVSNLLSESGCVLAADPTQPEAGLIPYQPNARFWSDSADKSRWIALPDGTQIDPSDSEAWEFPPGTITMKNFRVENKLVETRLFMRHPSGTWAGYTYEWNAAETEAIRVIGGKEKLLTLAEGTQNWLYPSEDECLQCHSAAAGYVLGVNTPQINTEFIYPLTGSIDNQLETFNHINIFTTDVPEPVTILPFITDPSDISQDIHFRAKAYLHTNCASCHQPGGGAPVTMDFRFATPLEQMNICNIAPQLSDLGVVDAKLIAPGDPDRSIILNRMNRRDNEAMPPIGSALVDIDGVALLTQWINQLACN